MVLVPLAHMVGVGGTYVQRWRRRVRIIMGSRSIIRMVGRRWRHRVVLGRINKKKYLDAMTTGTTAIENKTTESERRATGAGKKVRTDGSSRGPVSGSSYH